MNIVRRKTNVKLAINQSIERHPVPVLGVDYKVKIVYKNAICKKYKSILDIINLA